MNRFSRLAALTTFSAWTFGSANSLLAESPAETTRIHQIQGNSAETTLRGQVVTVEGIVTADFQSPSQLRGFFLQEEDTEADADPQTSEGIFVFCEQCADAVTEGQKVRVTGTVDEFHGMTQVVAKDAGAVDVTDAGQHLAEVKPSGIELPVTGNLDAFYEAREGMLVRFEDTLTVAETYELGRFGQIVLFEGERPHQFTEMNKPQRSGYNKHLEALDRRRVLLDDDNNGQNVSMKRPEGKQATFYPQAQGGFSAGTQGTDFIRAGDQVQGLTGVLHWSFAGQRDTDAWRIRPTAAAPIQFTVANPRPTEPPKVDGAIRAASANLLNYATTLDTTEGEDSGPCGPSQDRDCRGADSIAELNRQRKRTSKVLCGLDADVLALMELENTTPADTVKDLLAAVNGRCGQKRPYKFVDTGSTLGTDVIRVMLLYRSGTLTPVGKPLADEDDIHSRPPLAQTFEVSDQANPAFGKKLTVVGTHFKSKGCGRSAKAPNADNKDGQGCFSGVRTQQATRLLEWVASVVVPQADNPNILVLGDFNAYAQEPAITTMTQGGFTDLASKLLGSGAYSYLYDAQLGHLDYAFASASLVPDIGGIGIWHINADESQLFDYNDDIQDTGEAPYEEKPNGTSLKPPRILFEQDSFYRAADHDPVLVGIFPTAP